MTDATTASLADEADDYLRAATGRLPWRATDLLRRLAAALRAAEKGNRDEHQGGE